MSSIEVVAGNGLLHRRAFLTGGATFAAAVTGYTLSDTAAAQQLVDQPWSKGRGVAIQEYGTPSPFEKNVVRTLSNPRGEPRTQHGRTPHHLINGTFTPNGLHFVISHSGNPDIDPSQHRLVIHGLVRRPLEFTLDALHRYPMVSRMTFVECGGNSAPLFSNEPLQADIQAIHGLVSCSEWTGVMLSTLLDEAGIDPKAKWLIAEGADSLALSRSVPITKALDDAMIALYQNGERIMPGNGYPMRLLLPGWEGNMNVKWLRRLKLVEQPAMSYYEARTYAPILPGGKAYQFYFLQEVKSFITHPVAWLADERTGFLRDLRRRLLRQRAHREGDGVGRRREELGAGGVAGACSSEGVHPLPRPVALGRRTRRAAEPRMGRGRQRAANAGRGHRASRSDVQAADEPARVPQPALQRSHELARRIERRGAKCLRVGQAERDALSRSRSCRAQRSRRAR